MHRVWEGDRLGDAVALTVHADDGGDVTLAAASADKSAVVILRKDLGKFLRAHADADIACHDAGRLHWLLHDQLHGHKQGLKALWRLSEKSRLHDVALMDQRLCLVERAVYSGWKELEQLVQDLRIASPSLEPGEPGCPLGDESPAASSRDVGTQATRKANATLGVYNVLRDRADLIVANRKIPSELVAEFGPLGLGIDVQGAIALRSATQRGLLMSAAAADQVYRAAENLYRTSSASLAADKDARRGFEWTGEDAKARSPILDWRDREVHRNAEGIPRFRDQKLRNWLWTMFSRLRDFHGGLRLAPLDEEVRLSTDPEHWGLLIRCHPLLVAWRDLIAAAEISRCLPSHDDFVIHPRYEVIPRLRSTVPSLQQLPRFKQPLFRPRPGYTYLVGRFADLELLCFGVLCEARYRPGGSLIANIFAAGGDPVTEIAAELFATEPGRRPEYADWDFRELKVSNPNEHRRWLTISRVLLLAMPQSLATPQIRELLRQESPDCGLREADAERLVVYLYNRISELADFLEDSTFEVLARELGVGRRELENSLWMPDASETMGEALRNVLLGKRRGTPVWEQLRSLAERDESRAVVEQGKGGPDAYTMLANWPITLSGRIGRPGFCNQPRTTEYLDMADEVMKIAAYKLVAAGYDLVAVVDDQFVLEVADNQADVVERVEILADSAVESVLGWFPNQRCECWMTDTW